MPETKAHKLDVDPDFTLVIKQFVNIFKGNKEPLKVNTGLLKMGKVRPGSMKTMLQTARREEDSRYIMMDYTITGKMVTCRSAYDRVSGFSLSCRAAEVHCHPGSSVSDL